MTKSVNKIVILLVALLMCLTVVFAACNKANFTAVKIPATSEVESNGGIAVKYGEWLYYVNGYTTDTSADNTYSDDVKTTPRIGSVVRIKLSEIEKLLAIKSDKDLTSSKQTEKIASAIRGDVEGYEGAETVIPKIYYSGNTTTTQFTGIYIFGDRIYVTTPNDELTPNGDPLTDQLVLMSFDLGGGHPKSHYTFTSNSAQIWLQEVNGKVVASYLMDSVLHTLDVTTGTDAIVTHEYDSKKHIDNKVSSVNWDVEGNAIFFIDEFYSLCKVSFGQAEYEVICKNDTAKIHGDHIEEGALKYTIKSVRNGIVFYTMKNTEEGVDGGDTILYWAKSATESNVALPTSSASATSWKEDKLIVSKSTKSGEKTYYGIWLVTVTENDDGSYDYEQTLILKPGDNDSSITIDKIENDTLYYKSDSIFYTIDLNNVKEGGLEKGTPYAKSLPSKTGWVQPDFIDYTTSDGDVHYIISASTDTVTLSKFNPDDTKSSVVSITLTLTVASDK